MSRSDVIGVRKAAFLKGWRAENVAKNAKYHIELNDHLNYKEFGTPDYIDQDGRLYIVATHLNIRTPNPLPLTTANSRGRVKLYVKLPKGVEGYPENKHRILLELDPVRPDKMPPRTVVLRERFIMPTHRTGHVFIASFDWAQSVF